MRALRSLLVDAATIRRQRGRVHFWIEGYDDDPRELWHVPAVRAYVTALDEAFPYWFWFLSLDDPTLLLFPACCCPLEPTPPMPGAAPVAILPTFLAPYLARHFGGLDQLADRTGLPQAELAQLARAVLAAFGIDRVGLFSRQASKN